LILLSSFKNRKQKTRRRVTHASLLIGSGIIFSLLLFLIQPFFTFNLWISDEFLNAASPAQNIVVVGIDDKSLEIYGKWSEWPRNLHAQAITNLSKAGATVIGYDVIFSNSSPDDATFAEAISKAGNVVLATAGTGQLQVKPEGIVFQELLFPAPALRSAAANIGHVNVVPDADGKVRRLPLIVRQQDAKAYPSLSTTMLYTLIRKPVPVEYPIANGQINLLSRDIPVDQTYFMRLSYPPENSQSAFISYSDAIKGNFDPTMIKNKIVLVGMTATGDVDTWSLPNESVRVPGVYIHSAAMDTILRQNFLTELSLSSTLLIMLLLSLICALVLPLIGSWNWKGILKETGLTAGLAIVFLIAASQASGKGYLMNILYPVLILVVLYVINNLYVIIREQSDKNMVKNLFGRYVSPQIAKELVSQASEGHLKLGGELREVTILFADIRNYTKLSEQMTPEAIVNMLNIYLSVMIDRVLANDGLINKFAGDNIMAVWNAPQTQSQPALMAVKAAWEAQRAIEEMQRKDPSLVKVQFGVGINTGKALAGNVGSTGRSEYTVIGDAVNLASRICSGTPGTEIWVGQDTYRQIKDKVTATALAPQSFKGKAEQVVVYKIDGLK
jgi:adenylate cyclase